MENLQIIENNKLIAEFMGARYMGEVCFSMSPDEVWLPIYGICKYTTIAIGAGKILQYHNSWDWIMTALTRIESLNIVDETNIQWESVSKKFYCNILPAHNNTFNCIYKEGIDKLQTIYELVVAFCSYYKHTLE